MIADVIVFFIMRNSGMENNAGRMKHSNSLLALIWSSIKLLVLNFNEHYFNEILMKDNDG